MYQCNAFKLYIIIGEMYMIINEHDTLGVIRVDDGKVVQCVAWPTSYPTIT